jgi:lysozyme
MRVLIVLVLALWSTSGLSQTFPSYDRLPAQSLVEQFAESFGGLPPRVSARPLTVSALTLIKHFEGWVPNAGNDPVGYCTIGYGHLIALKRCQDIQLNEFAGQLSLERGEALLDEDTKAARITVQTLVKTQLTDEQFGALTSFVFNVGSVNFGRSTMLRLLNMNRYDLAVAEFGRWINANGQTLDGLVVRRSCEATLFHGQVQLVSAGQFNRAACISLGAAPLGGPKIDIYRGE